METLDAMDSSMLQPDSEILVASHNDHFGHFILDDLPGLLLLNGPLLSMLGSSHPRLPIKYRPSIIDILTSALKSTRVNEHVDFIDKQVKAVKASNGILLRNAICHQLIPASPFTNAYIWEKLKTRTLDGFSHTSTTGLAKPGLVFMSRTGIHKTRIANYNCISKMLAAHGFIELDASKYSIKEYAHVLSACRIIVCEAGSTTLAASMFCSEKAHIISMQSERLLRDTSSGMLLGGLPYCLAFPERLTIVLGKVVNQDPIQSSDLCIYDEDSLLGTIQEICSRLHL